MKVNVLRLVALVCLAVACVLGVVVVLSEPSRVVCLVVAYGTALALLVLSGGRR